MWSIHVFSSDFLLSTSSFWQHVACRLPVSLKPALSTVA